ncbi:MAG: HAD family hydrolase [Candidatus Neomarinimicrobiota bacterium]
MKDYDAIFLDRDGTLNPDPGYIASLADFQLFEFSLEALRLLAGQGQRFCIVTNQSGVERGLIDRAALEEIHNHLRGIFREQGIPLLGIYYCTDHPDQASENRKPGGGMFRQAAQEHQLDLARCLMIGDSGKDIEAGIKLGMDTMLVLTGEGRKTQKKLSARLKPDFIAESILTGAQMLIAGEK